jgi:site-specific DNA recombinase
MEDTTQPALTLDAFKQFGKHSAKNRAQSTSKSVVAYTRVSGKEQEKNMSLPYQRQVIDEYAKRNGLNIVAYFGGKFESAKTDGRKEFQRMLDFIKQSKGIISQILVYTIDRFSRSGGSAIKLAQELREKYGASINAISQPTDVTNPTGVFQQDLQFLFSKYDNTLRRQRILAGMQYKMERGIWIVRVPQGYDVIRVNGDRKIVINEEGQKIKMAFEWKMQGLKNEEIIQRLQARGLTIIKQQMVRIFKNPFYCGLLVHQMLNGKVVEGKHEAMISRETFLKVNGIMQKSGQLGVPHQTENINLPLKVFLKCDNCGTPFTGYIVQKKNLYYYKCRTKGCKCNRRNVHMHSLFENLLAQYVIKPELVKPLQYQLEHTFLELNKEKRSNSQALLARLKDVNTKLETIEEKYFALNQMNGETFNKFQTKYLEERKTITIELEQSDSGSSNYQKAIQIALEISQNLNKIWASGSVAIKERLQKLVFPDGIYYNPKKNEVRTEKVNSVFSLISSLSMVSGGNKKGQTSISVDLSSCVAGAGLEPTTFGL